MSKMKNQAIRTFLAVPLTSELSGSVGRLQKTLSSRIEGVRWVKSDNLHLTLFFFGPTTQEDLEKIKVSMLSVERVERSFEVAVDGLGAFPNLRRPRVLWLGLTPEEPLRELFRACRAALQATGYSPEARSFAPHLTIGRIRQNRSDLTSLAQDSVPHGIGRLPVTELILYESRLHQRGAEHIPLHAVELSGRN
ncbi:MAG: RNA 2',3'-cyclic phosphodiesterase [Deltaproteobacteria bacterium]|jgi:2'-5' RNA ligase|nr:RNA 2',3'-cyclic phosphodiesterase [Deltaproteobacteria bacterium]